MKEAFDKIQQLIDVEQGKLSTPDARVLLVEVMEHCRNCIDCFDEEELPEE